MTNIFYLLIIGYIRIANKGYDGTIRVRKNTEQILECMIIPATPTVLQQWTSQNKPLLANHTDILRYTFTPSETNEGAYTCEVYRKDYRREFAENVLLFY